MQMPNCQECCWVLAILLFALRFAFVDIACRRRTLPRRPPGTAERRRTEVSHGRRLMIFDQRLAEPAALRSVPEKLCGTQASIALDCQQERKRQPQEYPPEADRQRSHAVRRSE